MKELIEKYDRPGPRYTSYPPVPFWKGGVDHQTWAKHLKSELADCQQVDLYLHVPFCESLCWYCGCHRTITKDRSKGTEYVQLLKREWSLYEEVLPSIEVHSIHLGGGTPTFLASEDLDDLLSIFKHKTKNFIGSIEVDPRTCTEEHLDVLVKNGIKRISMGIQDFDLKVQQLIHRQQSVELVSSMVEKVRARGFESLNFDLIYGLPGQTLESVAQTIEVVKNLGPDCLAFYSYAHLPDKLKNQRLIKNEDLPTPFEKRQLYELGRELLLVAGYVEIGMDHFAKSSNYLAKGKSQKELKRSFMGYTDDKSNVLLGLGVSSISQTDKAYAQNAKDLESYRSAILSVRLPIVHGHWLNEKEQKTAANIQQLMCHGEAQVEMDQDLELLHDMERDGLLYFSDEQKISLTANGMALVRNVAMAIDPLLKDAQQKHFSRTV